MDDIQFRLLTYSEKHVFRQGQLQGFLVGVMFSFGLVALALILLWGR